MHTFLNCIPCRFVITIPTRLYCKNKKSDFLTLLKTMPKEPKHIPEAQKMRKKIKEKSSKYTPGRVTLQVLGTGAEGTPRSLYVFSDQSRYLFNCGEGTQRLAHEHKMKLAKLEHIFITQPSWKNIGGLPGTALTIQDVGVPEITLHGPQGLDELFVATKRFVVIKNLHITMADCSINNKFEDNVMGVEYVPLQKCNHIDSSKVIGDIEEAESFLTNSSLEAPTSISINSNSLNKDTQAGSSIDTMDVSTSTRSTKKRNRSRRNSQSVGPYIPEDIVEDDTDYYAHELSGTRTAPERISESSKLRLSEIKEKGISMAYICRLKPRPGALNLEKCVMHGVPPGPLLGTLKAGEDVTLDSGVIVRSVDVREPDDPGPVFIVIDCPSLDYIPSLRENGKFKRHQKYAARDDDLACLVVHFSPKSVTNHQSYKEWVNEFSPSTHHLVLNDSNSCMGSISVHRIQYKLNMLNAEIFPLLNDKGTEIEQTQEPCQKRVKTGMVDIECQVEDSSSSLDKLSDESSLSHDYIQANTLFNFHLRPRKGIDRSSELKLVPSQYMEETMDVEGFKDALQELKIKLLNKRIGANLRPYPKVLFLGTGSCIPNKTRNTSGILLETSNSCKILMDCGEGTYGQLVRFYGPEKINEILSNIKAVFVSHLHADHHIGLVGFLQGRRKALDALNIKSQPVYLLAPKQILNWLIFYDRCFENISDEYVIIPNSDLILGEELMNFDEKSKMYEQLNMTAINTVLVRHCPNAFGVALTHKDGYKITYSGDTMPCPNLIKLGMNSDLLIHEATMEDELAGEAVVKMHSTTSQAIDVGKSMKAKFILLTHFSQRYAKLPRFNENFADNIGIAFDNMQIRLDTLPLLPLLYPSLKLMFAEHYEELEIKAVKRQLRIERQRAASKERHSPTNNILLKV